MLIPKQAIPGNSAPTAKPTPQSGNTFEIAASILSDIAKAAEKLPPRKVKIKTVYGTYEVEHKGELRKRTVDNYRETIEAEGDKQGWARVDGTVASDGAKAFENFKKATPAQYEQARKAVTPPAPKAKAPAQQPRVTDATQSKITAYDQSRVEQTPMQEYTGGDPSLARDSKGRKAVTGFDVNPVTKRVAERGVFSAVPSVLGSVLMNQYGMSKEDIANEFNTNPAFDNADSQFQFVAGFVPVLRNLVGAEQAMQFKALVDKKGLKGAIDDLGKGVVSGFNFMDENASPIERTLRAGQAAIAVAGLFHGAKYLRNKFTAKGEPVVPGTSAEPASGVVTPPEPRFTNGNEPTGFGTAPKQEASPLEKLMAESKVVPETPPPPSAVVPTPEASPRAGVVKPSVTADSYFERMRKATEPKEGWVANAVSRGEVKWASPEYSRRSYKELQAQEKWKAKNPPTEAEAKAWRDKNLVNVDPSKDEVLGVNDRGETIHWSNDASTHYSIDKEGRVRTAPWIEGLSDSAIDRLHSLPETPTATKPTTETPGVTTSARKAQVAEDRANMGLGELDDAVRKSFGESLDNARAKGYGEAWASRESKTIKEKPRALNDEETAGMVDVMTGLKKQHKSVLNQIANETDQVKLDALRDSLTGIETQFDEISEAVKLSGTEKGRALASQKVTLNEDFDLISVKSRAKAAKGSALSTAEVEKYDDLVKRLDEAEARIAQVETQNVDLQKVIDSMPTGARSGRRIARSQTEIKAARTDALDRWTKSVTSTPMGSGVGGLLVDYKALGEYILTFAEEGVGKAEDVIRAAITHAKTKGIDIAEDDAKKALMEWGTPKKSTRELDNALFQRDRLRKEIRNAIADQGQSKAQKVVREATALPRALQATGDLSATLRQGLLLGAGNPVKAAESFGKAMKALFDPVYSAKLERELMSSPMALTRKKAGLYIADGETLSLAEEAFMSRLVKNNKILQAIAAPSERHYTTYLNQLRASVFDDMVAKFPDMNIQDQKALADFINVATGRGRLPVGTAEPLSRVFFSPRFMVSRAEAPLDALGLTKEGRAMWASDGARNQIMRSWGTTISGGVTLLSLAKLAGAKVGLDPDSPDFGKAKFGDTAFDIWGGFLPQVRLVAKLSKQIRSGKKSEFGKESAMELYRFLRYKAAPLPNIAFGAADKQDAIGQPFLVDKSGKMTAGTVAEDAIKSVTPLMVKDLASLWNLEFDTKGMKFKPGNTKTPIGAKVAGTVLAPLGTGVSTYKRKPKKD